MGLKIVEPGLLTTIQDNGRNGFQSYGFSVSGAMDALAMKLANVLVNNDENEAVLEMSFLGPTITFEKNVIIAITGANMSPKINQSSIPLGKPVFVNSGDTLQLRTAKKGVHSYLAVKGGFDIAKTLGSASTSMNAKIGGISGNKLEALDSIPINKESHYRSFNWMLSHEWLNYMNSTPIIHFITGRQYNWFTESAKQTFISKSYQVTPKSNRMGYRLDGPGLALNKQMELLSEGTTFGTIQVPPNGKPIVLMADRQPTGGYPKFGQVIQTDLPKLSQLRPNQPFYFKQVSLDESVRWLFNHHYKLSKLRAFINLKWKE